MWTSEALPWVSSDSHQGRGWGVGGELQFPPISSGSHFHRWMSIWIIFPHRCFLGSLLCQLKHRTQLPLRAPQLSLHSHKTHAYWPVSLKASGGGERKLTDAKRMTPNWMLDEVRDSSQGCAPPSSVAESRVTQTGIFLDLYHLTPSFLAPDIHKIKTGAG